MDAIRSISVVSVAELLMLGAMAPALAEGSGEESDHRRHHVRGHAETISHSRADYPVIFHWVHSPPSDGIANDIV